jgi:hypothetical protein
MVDLEELGTNGFRNSIPEIIRELRAARKLRKGLGNRYPMYMEEMIKDYDREIMGV